MPSTPLLDDFDYTEDPISNGGLWLSPTFTITDGLTASAVESTVITNGLGGLGTAVWTPGPYEGQEAWFETAPNLDPAEDRLYLRLSTNELLFNPTGYCLVYSGGSDLVAWQKLDGSSGDGRGEEIGSGSLGVTFGEPGGIVTARVTGYPIATLSCYANDVFAFSITNDASDLGISSGYIGLGTQRSVQSEGITRFGGGPVGEGSGPVTTRIRRSRATSW